MKLQDVKHQIDNFFMDITQERIEELEQQYQLTKNENWLVLKMDLEEQYFKSKCKKLLNIYEKSNIIGFCSASYGTELFNFVQKELKPFVPIFLAEIQTIFKEGIVLFFYHKGSTIQQDREIRIKFLKWLINENNI